jgi:NAD(P)-dependent dehydrogenase (short-subunit alcohol dehydrogenase family)
VLNNGFRERGGGSVQRKVAIVTGASQGTGAGLVAAYRRHGFAMHSPQDYVLATGDKMSGFFHLTQRVITQMLHQGDGGHVVTMTPTRARHAYVNIPSALAAITEGGLIAATTSLAKEYARSGIRVNAVSPCAIGTPAHSDDSPAALAAVHPRGQFGVIDEVVRAVLYLEAASDVTGEVLHLDGGHLAGR